MGLRTATDSARTAQLSWDNRSDNLDLDRRDAYVAERSPELLKEYLADEARLSAATVEWISFGMAEDLLRSVPLFVTQVHSAKADAEQADAALGLYRSLMEHVRPILREWAEDAAKAEFDRAEEARGDARDAA